MPRSATGQVRYNDTKGCYETRLRYSDGKRLWVAMPKGLSRAQAEARSRVWAKTAIANPSPPPRLRAIAQPGVETVDDYFVRWCVERKRAGILTVYDDERRYFVHVSPIIGQLAAARITADQVEDVKEALDAKSRAGSYVDKSGRRRSFGAKSAQNVWVMLLGLFKSASRKGKVRALRIREDNPISSVPSTSTPTKKAKQFLYPSELLALVSCAVVPTHWRRGYAIAVFAYIRSGELEVLTWADVDIEHRLISVNKALQSDGTVGPPKNGLARSVPLEENLVPMLTAMRAEADERARAELGSRARRVEIEAAIARSVVVPMPQRNNRSEILREDLARAGVVRADLFTRDATRTPLTYHDLRASGITWCAVRGDDPFTLQANAGHADVTTTQLYIRKAATLRRGFGEPFPPLPVSLLHHRTGTGPGTSMPVGS